MREIETTQLNVTRPLTQAEGPAAINVTVGVSSETAAPGSSSADNQRVVWAEGTAQAEKDEPRDPPLCPSTSVGTGAAVGKRGGGHSLALGRGSHRAGQAGAQGHPGRQATDRSALKSERPGETLTLPKCPHPTGGLWPAPTPWAAPQGSVLAVGAPRGGADPAGPGNTRSYPAPAAETPRGEPPATGLPYTPKFATGLYLKSTKSCLGIGPAPAQNWWTPLAPGLRAWPEATRGYDLSLRSSCGWALRPAQPLLGSRRSQERKTASP